MNTSQKRKAKKFTYRRRMREKIAYIQSMSVDFWGDSIDGYSRRGKYFSHLTNFVRWQLPVYRTALMSYRGNKGQFGLSDTSMVFNSEEGWSREAPEMGALFVSGPREDLSDFWDHFKQINDELTRYTRRERQRDPRLENNNQWRTFRRPRS